MTDILAARLDRLDEVEAGAALARCCAARAWIAGMLAARPFGRDEVVFDTAATAWRRLEAADWLEAFAAHPRIGERGGSRWSQGEQAGAAAAPDEVRTALEAGNRAYEERFGHVFLICATGLDAVTMLAELRRRLGHDAATELHIAAAEQAKITRLRLAKLAEDLNQGAAE